MMISSNKEFEREGKALLAKGWQLIPGKKHRKLRSPGGAVLAVPGSPSDGGSLKVWLGTVRRIERAEAAQHA